MKSIINKLPIILIFLVFQFCKSQNKERYVNDYNKTVPKLQQVVKLKQQFYGKGFSDFNSELNDKGIEINNFTYLGETDISPKVTSIILFLSNTDDFGIAIDNNYQVPQIKISFQKQVPDEIRQLTLKNKGELTQEVKDFLANKKIAKIEFYGINGLTSNDRSAR